MKNSIQYFSTPAKRFTSKVGHEFEGLGQGLGNASGDSLYQDYMSRQKKHLINTRNAIATSPENVKVIYQPEKLISMCNELINSWDNNSLRDQTLERLSGIEEEALIPQLQGLGYIIHSGDGGGLWDAVDGSDIVYGLGGSGFFTKIKNAVKKVKSVVKNTGQKAINTAKGVASATVKFNPLSVAARASFLVAMKTNFGRIASRAYYAYFTESEAKAKGVSSSYWKSANELRKKLESIFVNKLKGKPENLNSAILKGRAANVSPKLAQEGRLQGLGSASPESIEAAISLLKPIMEFIKTLFAKHEKGDTEMTEEEINISRLSSGGGSGAGTNKMSTGLIVGLVGTGIVAITAVVYFATRKRATVPIGTVEIEKKIKEFVNLQ
ncbi:MAG: hypothetical protein M3Q58_03415 [Bacteroidota bacterium]|nr:hypothetical protein [Bacteroidota bacterium]